MTNIRNLRSKGSREVKYKNVICAEVCLKLWFESDCYFCSITKSGWVLCRTPPVTAFVGLIKFWGSTSLLLLIKNTIWDDFH